ncbi:MAG: hypothetical protein Tsb0020_32670 [Haliangiales bacterium]
MALSSAAPLKDDTEGVVGAVGVTTCERAVGTSDSEALATAIAANITPAVRRVVVMVVSSSSGVWEPVREKLGELVGIRTRGSKRRRAGRLRTCERPGADLIAAVVGPAGDQRRERLAR